MASVPLFQISHAVVIYIRWCRHGKNKTVLSYETLLTAHRQTVSSGYTLFAVLANYPEVQRRAQEEVDAAIGHERLPKVADLPDLVYLQALVKELLRWHSVLPMGKSYENQGERQLLIVNRLLI